jgi:hypothetical protein
MTHEHNEGAVHNDRISRKAADGQFIVMESAKVQMQKYRERLKQFREIAEAVRLEGRKARISDDLFEVPVSLSPERALILDNPLHGLE